MRAFWVWSNHLDCKVVGRDGYPGAGGVSRTPRWFPASSNGWLAARMAGLLSANLVLPATKLASALLPLHFPSWRSAVESTTVVIAGLLLLKLFP